MSLITLWILTLIKISIILHLFSNGRTLLHHDVFFFFFFIHDIRLERNKMKLKLINDFNIDNNANSKLTHTTRITEILMHGKLELLRSYLIISSWVTLKFANPASIFFGEIFAYNDWFLIMNASGTRARRYTRCKSGGRRDIASNHANFRHASFMECKTRARAGIYILASAETAIPSGHWRCCAVKIYDFARHKCRAKRIFLTPVLPACAIRLPSFA